MRLARAFVLDRLAEALDRYGGAGFPPVLIGALYDVAREEDGMAGRDASRVALRGCKLAVMLLDGLEQRSAAQHLGVSERTGKSDFQRLRRVVESGVLSGSAP